MNARSNIEQPVARPFRGIAEIPMRRVSRVHFIGIGGVGMAGIAEVLINLGYEVSGSDLKEGASVTRLRGLGAKISIGHDAKHVVNANVVVVTSAVDETNPEVIEAHDLRLPVVRRAEMLAELMRFRYGIAVAGTHGKTSTTSLLAALLSEGGLDPTFVVGGKVTGFGANARLGEGPYLVAEADESDASFLLLSPMMGIITNIDADHMETYGGDFEQLKNAFREFVHHLPFYGLAVVCVDDEVIQEMLPDFGRQVLTYGIETDADIWAENLEPDGQGTHFRLRFKDNQQGWNVRLNLPGRHNVLNALAAVGVAHELGVDMTAIQAGLTAFQGIGRRCEVLGEIRVNSASALLVDDYGHHPKEIECTLQAVRSAWPERRLVVAFQPHRYSRTRDLFEDFCQVLGETDVLILSEVYAAGETPIPKADGRALARGIRMRNKVNPVFVDAMQGLAKVLPDIVQDGDLLLTLGAGDVGQVAHGLVEQFSVAGGSA